MSLHRVEVVTKSGIAFAGTDWWAPELQRHVSLPKAERRVAPLPLELRYDYAARSRGTLREVVVLVRDERGAVVERFVCRRRSEVQRTANRSAVRAQDASYEDDLKARRDRLQLAATRRQAGVGASRAQLALITPAPSSKSAAIRSVGSDTGARGAAASATGSIAPAKKGAAKKPTHHHQAGRTLRKKAPTHQATRRQGDDAKRPIARGAAGRSRGGALAALAARTTGGQRPARRPAHTR